ncbi:MAG: hypothetical protein J6S19_04370 [Lentisphaeria bacterium]|nr:hypothetical protein [Lentisphaeria bacterium]
MMSRKYLVWLPFLSALLTALAVWRRELWFDEALTLLNFVLPLDLGRIYFNYTIPNNHIVYSIMLKIWDWLYCGFIDPVAYWRLLSMLCALRALGIILYLRGRIDSRNFYPAVLVLTAMTVSPVFMNYATALRGYAAGWLFIAMALAGLYNIFCGKTRAGWWIYTIAALLAVGTTPTNLLALAAAFLYALPWIGENFYRDKRFYLAAAVLPLALVLFYAPIAPQFLATFSLGEGFSSRNGAWMITLGMYVSSFGLLLFFALLALERKNRVYLFRYAIWLLPALAIYILHRAPFPRVFVTLLPVLAMAVIDGIAKLTANNWRSTHRIIFFLTVAASQALLIPAGYLAAEKAQLSRYEDDFFHPWYMFPKYRISDTAAYLQKNHSGKTVFVSFSADPVPVMFYAAMQNVKCNFKNDVPYMSVKELPAGTIAVLRKDESPAVYSRRFNRVLHKLCETTGHNIYLVVE